MFILILVVSAFLHFYLLPTHLHFLGDEAKMSEAIKEIYTLHRFTTIGLLASIGHNIYQSSYFYYFYLIPGILTGFTPIGFGITTIILSLLSLIFLYLSIKELFGNRVAILTAIIYGLSATIIFYGRWEWDPNPIPFLVSLSLFSLIMFFKGKEWFLILFAFCTSSISQLHFTGYVMIPVLIVLLPGIFKSTKNYLVYLLSIIAFLIPIAPFAYHEIKYRFVITKELIYILLHPTSHTSFFTHMLNGWNGIFFMFSKTIQINYNILILILIGSIGILILRFRQNRTKEMTYSVLFILSTLFFSFIMFAFYPSMIFVHYGEHLFPIFAFLFAIVLSYTWERKELIGVGVFLLLIFFINNYNSYINDYVKGPQYLKTYNSICQYIKDNNLSIYNITLNQGQDTFPLIYVCQNDYGIRFNTNGSMHKLNITTDYINKLKIIRS